MPAPLIPVIVAEGVKQLAANPGIIVGIFREIMQLDKELTVELKKAELIGEQQRRAYEVALAEIEARKAAYVQQIEQVQEVLHVKSSPFSNTIDVRNDLLRMYSESFTEVQRKVIHDKDISDDCRKMLLDHANNILESVIRLSVEQTKTCESYRDVVSNQDTPVVTASMSGKSMLE